MAVWGAWRLSLQPGRTTTTCPWSRGDPRAYFYLHALAEVACLALLCAPLLPFTAGVEEGRNLAWAALEELPDAADTALNILFLALAKAMF